MKSFIWTLIRMLLKIYTLLPIDNKKIIFISYGGNQYSCNPKYISEYIVDNFPGRFDIIWAFKEPENYIDLQSSQIKIVSIKSIDFIKEFYTSKMIITNDSPHPFLGKRKKQIGIQTWHGGGAYKKVGRNTALYSKGTSRQLTKSMQNMNLYLSSCKKFSECLIKDAFLYDGDILENGMPRNDFLMNQTGIKNKVKTFYAIPEDHFVILYAPTFRQSFDPETYKIDYMKLMKSIKEKYNRECTILIRAHHKVNESQKEVLKTASLVDASLYSDMQELLYDVDMLITDYSSSMWDFSLMYKPCFIFAPDAMEYKQERDFYTPMEEWPFPIATNNDELIKNMELFDNEKYKMNVSQHHEALGSFETGNATEEIVKYIIEKMDH